MAETNWSHTDRKVKSVKENLNFSQPGCIWADSDHMGGTATVSGLPPHLHYHILLGAIDPEHTQHHPPAPLHQPLHRLLCVPRGHRPHRKWGKLWLHTIKFIVLGLFVWVWSDNKHPVCSLPVLVLWFRWAVQLLRACCTISSWLRSAGCVWKECSCSAWWCWSSTQRWDPSIWLPLVMEFLLSSLQFQLQWIQVDMALVASEF